MCCASCGIAEVDDIKLKDCDGGCDLVKYCSDDCQNDHRDQHEEECKKRLRDNDLLTRPGSSCYGDCPICCLPQSIDVRKSGVMPCCSKRICIGCDIANKKREVAEGLDQRCIFCREPVTKSEEEADERLMESIKRNDPNAMYQIGTKRLEEGDYETAFKYLSKAAGLGDAEAHFNLSELYYKGEGVVEDVKKAVYHWEEAAIAGHPEARHNLGYIEAANGNFERAKNHWIIAANLGCHGSLKNLRALYAKGHASREDYASALRAYQAALDATKSADREKADNAIKSGEIRYIPM